jgi:hypothetical protein
MKHQWQLTPTIALALLMLLWLVLPATEAAHPKNKPPQKGIPGQPPGVYVMLRTDKDTVKAGDPVNLDISFQGVKSAALESSSLLSPTPQSMPLSVAKGGKLTHLTQTETPCINTFYELTTTLKSGPGPGMAVGIDVTGQCLPDLAVGDITPRLAADPNNANNMLLAFVVTYKNVGKDTAPGVPLVATYAPTGAIVKGTTMPLGPGEENELHLTDMSVAKGQQLSFTITLDPDNKLTESDKSNNLKTLLVPVS